jgi:hypothetical protein
MRKLIFGLMLSGSVAVVSVPPGAAEPRSGASLSLSMPLASLTPASIAPPSPGLVAFVLRGDATAVEIQAVGASAKIANFVRASKCFHDFMAKRTLVATNGRSPVQVADHLQSLSGAVPVEFYFRCMARSKTCQVPSAAVAYRQPPGNTIYINRARFDVERKDFDPYELAGTLNHEAVGHTLGGYDHPFEWTTSRDFTVPYSISGASRVNGDASQHCRKPLGY